MAQCRTEEVRLGSNKKCFDMLMRAQNLVFYVTIQGVQLSKRSVLLFSRLVLIILLRIKAIESLIPKFKNAFKF